MIQDLIVPVLIIVGFIVGIRLMQSPQTAVWGNRLGALCMVVAIGYVFLEIEAVDSTVWIYLAIGAVGGILLGQTVRMIRMPQTVALFNGLGGGASALVALAAMAMASATEIWVFWLTAALALGIGTLTFTGSIVASLKLQGMISERAVFLRGHVVFLWTVLVLGLASAVLLVLFQEPYYQYAIAVLFAVYGLLMSIRIGGADMPVIISLLNSFSGVAAAVSGLAVGNLVLVGVGSLVGVAGMILTQLMCRGMNRDLGSVLSGFTTSAPAPGKAAEPKEAREGPRLAAEDIPLHLKNAKKVIIVPGYGMAVAQAQQSVKALADCLERHGKEVKVAIHPVAGRMPGHMNVLLAEAGIDHEKLLDMDAINPEFCDTDVVLVVGACDVVNPAATTAEGTVIYGMPILNASEAKVIVVCNLDDKPGYSGVDNTLYDEDHVITLWGDAAETVPKITEDYLASKPEE